jgi:hypothetical protein
MQGLLENCSMKELQLQGVAVKVTPSSCLKTDLIKELCLTTQL